MIALDVYFFLNFAFDLLLLQAAAGMTGQKRVWKRITAGAGLGALWSCIALVLGERGGTAGTVCKTVTYLICPACMCRLAYGPSAGNRRVRLSAVCCFYLTAFGTGGIMSLFSRRIKQLHWWELLLAMAGAQLVLGALDRYRRKQEVNKTLFLHVLLHFGKGTLDTTGLWDTGNRLCSLTGRPVHLLDRQGAYRLLGKEQTDRIFEGCRRMEEGETGSYENSGVPVRLIPFRAAGCENGWLPVVEMDRLTVWRESGPKTVEKPLIAISKTMFDTRENYCVILNPSDLH